MTKPIGRFYLVEVGHKDGPYYSETVNLARGKDQSEDDGFIALTQERDPEAIWECNPSEGTMRDVSEDMARRWLEEYNGDYDDLPNFICEHIGISELQGRFRDLY